MYAHVCTRARTHTDAHKQRTGIFVFSDLMQSDCADPKNLAAVYARLGLADMGSPAKYIQVVAAD